MNSSNHSLAWTRTNAFNSTSSPAGSTCREDRLTVVFSLYVWLTLPLPTVGVMTVRSLGVKPRVLSPEVGASPDAVGGEVVV